MTSMFVPSLFPPSLTTYSPASRKTATGSASSSSGASSARISTRTRSCCQATRDINAGLAGTPSPRPSTQATGSKGTARTRTMPRSMWGGASMPCSSTSGPRTRPSLRAWTIPRCAVMIGILSLIRVSLCPLLFVSVCSLLTTTTESTLISAMPGSDYDNRFKANDWGNAWSKPDRVYDSLCSQ